MYAIRSYYVLIGRGGINAYTGLSNMQLVEEKAVAGDKQCTILLEAMSYNFV